MKLLWGQSLEERYHQQALSPFVHFAQPEERNSDDEIIYFIQEKFETSVLFQNCIHGSQNFSIVLFGDVKWALLWFFLQQHACVTSQF